jgi:hypothetical protein
MNGSPGMHSGVVCIFAMPARMPGAAARGKIVTVTLKFKRIHMQIGVNTHSCAARIELLVFASLFLLKKVRAAVLRNFPGHMNSRASPT